MIRVVYDDPAAYTAWAVEKIGIAQLRDDARSIGVARGGGLVAAVVYDTFSPGSCCVHVASDGSRTWVTRDVVWRAMAYPFLQLGLRRITAMIPASNLASLGFARHFGFKQEGVLREGAPDGDVIMLGMLRRECKWLQES